VNLDDEIENWRRVVRTGRVCHRCGSLEGQYRKTGLEVLLDGEPLPPPSAPLNVLRGWQVELAWRSLPAVSTRLLVSWHYIRNRSIQEAARKARVEQRKAWEELNHARMELARRLSTC
jgi:uncharacterized membrane-anchored protein